MKLSEIFRQLSYGELSQLNIGNTGAGEISDADYDRLVSAINLGLTALYTRFPLSRKTLELQLVSGQGLYYLSRSFAVSNEDSLEDPKYIRDSNEDPFMDDLLKVLQVTTGTGDVILPLNKRGDLWSLYTPTVASLSVPYGIHTPDSETPSDYVTATLLVEYQANHLYLPVGVGEYRADTVDVELPYAYLEPLLYYVASRMHNPIGMVNEFHMGNSFAAKYEAACQTLERHNVSVDQVGYTTKFADRGWV